MEKNSVEIWKKVLGDIETEISRANFFTLFKPTSLISLDEHTAVISAPSTMVIDLLQKRFLSVIKKQLDKHTGKDITILFTTKLGEKIEMTEEKTGPLFSTSETAEKPKEPIPPLPITRVRADFTFQNFAVSSSNQLAFVSSSTVAANIGNSYNPFFIYGPVGVGKTHLMHAIANEVHRKHPEKKIIYITSEEFTNEVVEAIRNNDTARMKKRFRSAFLLLIDDIQFIEGKDRVQEELFHTFNILIDQGSQICLSSDRPPHEIKRLEKRLSSRFAGGLSVDIEPPDFELKTAILLIKAKKYNVELPIDVAKIIADGAEDTRSLEGLLLRVITQAQSKNAELTIELAQKALGSRIEEKKTHIHADDIISAVCSFYQVKPTQLKGPKRDASLVKARQIAMYLLKHELGLTFVEIGNMLGGRDHTTVMHGVEKMEKLLQDKAHVSEEILGITKGLRG